MPELLDTVRAAWRDLADRELLCPPGWCGIVTVGTETISSAPDDGRAHDLRTALGLLPPEQHTDPLAMSRLLDVADVLGPASLAYRATPRPDLAAEADETTPGDPEVQELLAGCTAEERGEAAVEDVTSPVFLLRSGGNPVALAGYQLWPGRIAHLSVLTAPEARGRGSARQVAAAATEHAVRRGLLAQWRARPVASQRVAAALGFQTLGRQLSLDVRPSPLLTDDVVTLRCLRPEDAPAHLAGEDAEQVRWLNEGHHSTPARVAEWISENVEQWRTRGPRRHLAILDADTGELAGGVEANLGLLDGAPRVVNLSYAVFPRWRGRGYAARAVALLNDWLPMRTPATTAVLRIEEGNNASHGVARAAGFSRTGTMLENGTPFVRYERDLRGERSRPLGPSPWSSEC